MEEYSAAHTKHLEINFADKNDSIEIILSTFKLISSFFPLCLFLLLTFFFIFSVLLSKKFMCQNSSSCNIYASREFTKL